jgi:hypothetical protein
MPHHILLVDRRRPKEIAIAMQDNGWNHRLELQQKPK